MSSVILLRVLGAPGTCTPQQKGMNARMRTYYTAQAVKQEKARIIRSLRFYDGTEFVPMKSKWPVPFDEPIHLSVKYIFPLTEADARKYVDRLEDPTFERYHVVAPDFDNVVKLLVDVLSSVGFWVNDSQICNANISKRRGPTPGIHIAFRPLPPLP